MRKKLESLIREKNVSYEGLSRLLGRNPAYIHQYLFRGIPRELKEADRAIIAKYFDISEHQLGGPQRPDNSIINIPLVSSGMLKYSDFQFDVRWLSKASLNGKSQFALMEINDRSLEPVIHKGDEVLIDRSEKFPTLSDGIYALQINRTLVLKRVFLNGNKGRCLISDIYQDKVIWDSIDKKDIKIFGRAIRLFCAL
mgnify:CR=1 FL=1